MKGPEADKIEQMFDSIAPEYDKLNHILSLDIDRTWRRRSLKRIVCADRAQKILDVACGTGDYSIEIARASHPDTRVYGVDLSEGMLAVMAEKLSAACLTDKVVARRGNAEQLQFPNEYFDRVTIGFGIRNFENREDALCDILRVLKPGGRLVILELSVPSNRLLRRLYELYFLKILPLIGGRVSGDRAAYKYLPASVLNFPGRQEWMEIMRSCGYRKVTHKAFTFGICRMYTGEK